MKKNGLPISIVFFFLLSICSIIGFFLLPEKTLAQTSCSATPTSSNSVITSVSISGTNMYKIWSRINAPDTVNNSYWLQIDGGCAINIGDTSITANTWTWVNYAGGVVTTPLTISLSNGLHTVKIIQREAGVSVDRILFTPDSACVPVGTGDNCIIMNTPIPTVSPTPKTPNPTIQSDSTKLKLNLLLHGVGKAGDNVNPAGQGNFALKNGQRTVTVEIYNAQNQLVLTKQGTATFDTTIGGFTGIFDIGTSIITGSYIVKVKMADSLKTLVPGIQKITNNVVNTLPTTLLMTGDINGDNIVNILDYAILMNCYSDLAPAVNCSTTNKTLTDLNDDGAVNQVDYNLFIRELSNKQGD